MLILGEKEQVAENISIRQHKVGDLGSKDITEFVEQLKSEINNKTIHKEER